MDLFSSEYGISYCKASSENKKTANINAWYVTIKSHGTVTAVLDSVPGLCFSIVTLGRKKGLVSIASMGDSLVNPRLRRGQRVIVVGWFVCLFVICESTYLDATALRLQHG